MLPQLAPHGGTIEGEDTLERQQSADPSAGPLDQHFAARGDGIVYALVKGTPILRQLAELHDAEGGGHVTFERKRLQPVNEVVQPLGGRQIFLRDLEDPGLQIAHHSNQRPHFIPRGEPAGHWATVGRLVRT